MTDTDDSGGESSATTGPYLPLSPYLFVVLFPFYWMVITAFKRDSDLYNLTTAPFWFKEPPTLAHLELLLERHRCS